MQRTHLQVEREGFAVWFTGLPCSGKSTLARLLEGRLTAAGIPVEVLDGDEVRRGMSRGLGYSKQGREENLRRVANAAKNIMAEGRIAITATISPYLDSRDRARKKIGRFLEVYLQCPIEVCVQRDCKGLFQRALRGEITHFTGVSDIYEEPFSPEVALRTDLQTPEECVQAILQTAIALGYLQPAFAS
jgi:adenylylsulfate kinase